MHQDLGVLPVSEERAPDARAQASKAQPRATTAVIRALC